MSFVEIMKKIAELEVNKIHTLELGVVESVEVRENESSKSNYECAVLLKGRLKPDGTPIKIEHVPILTSHMGEVSIPCVDDLVVVGFLEGNFALPVIIGRLYTTEKKAPLYGEGEKLLYFDPEKYGGKEAKHIIKFKDGFQIIYERRKLKFSFAKTQFVVDATEEKEATISISTGKTRVKIKHDSDIEIVSNAKLNIHTKKDVSVKCDGELKVDSAKAINVSTKKELTIKCTNAKIAASGSIELGEGGGGVVTVASHKCFITGAPPIGSTTVKAKL